MSALTLYKKTGAVRFSADPLRGVIFVSFARPLDRKTSEGQETQKGRRKYRWEEKVTIALDPSEASIIGAFARLVLSGNTPQKNPVIHHTPEKFGKKGPEKTIRIDRKTEGFALEIEVRGEKITVGPIGFSDFYLIDAFLTRFIPDILPKPRIAVPPSVEAEVPREESTEEVEAPEEILF